MEAAALGSIENFSAVKLISSDKTKRWQRVFWRRVSNVGLGKKESLMKVDKNEAGKSSKRLTKFESGNVFDCLDSVMKVFG